MSDELNAVYHERDQVVAALTKLFPAVRTVEDGEWRIVYLTLPTGQVSWHYHESEDGLFEHVPSVLESPWDGHTTDEKYARLAALKSTAS